MGAVNSMTLPMTKALDEPMPPKAQEIHVMVNRDGTRPVGVRVQIEVGSLTVLEIQAGLIRTWNEEHLDLAICPGDEIASVNGHTSQSEILTELQLTRQQLDIVFLRNQSDSEVSDISAQIVRTTTRRELGLDVDQDPSGLIVTRVRAGLVRDWNATQATHRLMFQAGMRILSVNGLKDAREMKRELQISNVLRITASSGSTRPAQRRRTNSSSEVKVVQLPFVKASDCANGDEPQVCGICLDEVDADQCVVRLTCSHIFHVECATKWLTKCNCACPVCRQAVQGNISERSPLNEAQGQVERERPRLPTLVHA